jgi:hypothetical protein
MTDNFGLWLAPCLALGLVACGSDDDGGSGASVAALEGIYEVSTHTQNLADCDSPGDAVSEYTHFELRRGESFLGIANVEMFECQDASASSCEMDFSSASFFQDGSSWRVETSYASGSDDLCSVGKNTAVLEATDGGARIERRSYHGSITTPAGQDCLVQEADDHMDALSCELEVIEGMKL